MRRSNRHPIGESHGSLRTVADMALLVALSLLLWSCGKGEASTSPVGLRTRGRGKACSLKAQYLGTRSSTRE